MSCDKEAEAKRKKENKGQERARLSRYANARVLSEKEYGAIKRKQKVDR